MSGYQTKVYVVQKADHYGVPGDVIAVKLTHGAAHAIAKQFAPCRVHFAIADKSDELNVAQRLGQNRCS